ncbi:YadA-like family protein [Salmonella enterica]|nr:YadA-like family protein [Salmonella enterica]EJX4474837.1 YadA-like family protein [Salmonella enterica]EKS4543135.1 YadA-like family protein [Salmonella enterica]EKS4821384.1 YadA-like family protein [Salmonella enterica]
MKGIQITPIALLVVNTISMSSAYADIPVTCHTTGTSESDLFCGSVSNTNGAVKSLAIGNNAFIPKAIIPGKTGIEQAIAIGSNVQATGDNSLVIGNDAITGKTGSVAIGGDDAAGTYHANGKGYILRAAGSNSADNNLTNFRANAAIGNGAVSLGANSQALSDGAVSIGAAATAGAGTQNGTTWNSTSGRQSIAVGAESSALQDNSIALGYRSEATGNSSTAIGNNALAKNNNALAIGRAASATGEQSIALGMNSGAEGSDALALGNSAHADAAGAILIGRDAKNTKDTLSAVGLPADNGINAIGIGSAVKSAANGIAIGRGAEAKISEATTIAIGNGAVSAGGIAIGQGASVVKGNNPSGTASASVSVGRQTVVADYGVALGSRASVGITLTGDGNPERVTTGGLYGTAVGINSGVYSNSALAVGHNAKVSENANAALAIGYNSLSSAQNAIAIGKGAKASADNTISIGTGNIVSGTNSGAIGDPSTVSGVNSYSIGNNNIISASNAFVLGNAVNNAVDNSVVLGNDSTVSAAIATPGYSVNGVSHKFAGSSPISTVSIGDSGKERTLTNVAAGRLSPVSTDAINGSQLFAVTSEVEKGNLFAGNTGTFSRRLGETTTIRGGLAEDAAASNKNIRTVAKDGQVDILLADNLNVRSVKTGDTLLSTDGLHITGGPSVTTGGINAGNRVISNVGDAVNDTDAVNKRQLDNLSSIVGQGLTFAANEGGDITRKPGDTLSFKGEATTKGDYSGKNIKTVTDISSGIISIKIAESPVFGSVVVNDSNSGKITGVSNGIIAAESRDVVNGGQIHRITTSIGNVIGGNAYVDQGGALVASNIGNTGKNTIHDAIDSVRSTAETASAGWNLSVNGQQSSAVKPKETVDLNNNDGNIHLSKKDNQVTFNLSDSVKVKESIGIVNGPSLNKTGIDSAGMKITNVADGVIAAGSKDAVNGGQIHDFVSGEVTRPITFAADSGTPYDARLGSTVNIKGDDKNIRTVVNGNSLSVSLNERINVKSVTATESLSVASGANVDMGGNTIHNVGNATRPGDAVNYGQFQQAFSSLGNQINRVERRANAGAAAAIATAGLTQAYIPGKSMMSMSGGTFQGESSLAIGLSTISDNGNWVLKGSFSSTTRNQTGASVGIGFQF